MNFFCPPPAPAILSRGGSLGGVIFPAISDVFTLLCEKGEAGLLLFRICDLLS